MAKSAKSCGKVVDIARCMLFKCTGEAPETRGFLQFLTKSAILC